LLALPDDPIVENIEVWDMQNRIMFMDVRLVNMMRPVISANQASHDGSERDEFAVEDKDENRYSNKD
jgi:hypothetical protein